MKIQEGNYRARPVFAQLGTSATGTEHVEIQFMVLEDDGSPTRVERSGYFFLTDRTFQRTIETLRLCGWQGDDLSDLSSISEETSPDVQIVFGEEEYEGKLRMKLKWVNPWRPPRASAPQADAKTRAEVLREKVRAADAALAARRPAPKASMDRREQRGPVEPRGGERHPPDDDIPF